MVERRRRPHRDASSKGQNRPGYNGHPWYESTLVWGSASLAIALILTVVVARELRWLLLFAWVFLSVVSWGISKGVGWWTRRRFVVVLTWPVFAVVMYGLYAFLEPPAVTVSPNHISVTSTDWTGVIDVTVTNHREEPWYNADFLIKPTDAAVEYSVEPLGGPGSEILLFAMHYSDGSEQWAISRLAPKGSAVFRLKTRLRTKSSKAEIRFSTSPGSREPGTPRVMFHQ